MLGAEGHEGQEPWAAPGAGSSADHGAVGPPPPLAPPPPWPPGLAGGPPPGTWSPAPPARRSRAGLVLLLIAGALVVVAAAVALVTRVRGDDGAGDGRFAEADPADAATVAVPDDYEEVEIGDVSVSLPLSWVWVRLDQGVEGLGDQLAPDDPQLASDLDDRLRSLPRSALLIGYDEGDLQPPQFNTNVVVAELPDALPDRAEEMRAAIAAEVEGQGTSVASVSYLTSSEGPVLRVRYRLPLQGVELEGLQYWYTTPDGPYTLSFTSDDLDDYVEAADAMASSFDVDATA
jgi:hypothetical protein